MSILGPEWHISDEGKKIITENSTLTNKNKILNNALNTDIKEIGVSALANQLAKGEIKELVLQIQKIRNIAAPKANEDSQAAPRMLKLVLTDGETYAQALEVQQIQAISRDKTPPGTKILIRNAKIINSYIILNPSNCIILGGKVPHMYEKWELAKTLQYQSRRIASNDGAPVWVNFGCKISMATPDNFKSIDGKKVKENEAFDMQRKDAIAGVTTGAVKKVFGGGVKQIQNNQQTRPNSFKPYESRDKSRNAEPSSKDKGRGTKIKIEKEEKPMKPSEKVSLFDFLEDKLPVNEAKSSTTNFDHKDNSKGNNFKSNSYNQNYSQNYNQNYNQNYKTQNQRPMTVNKPDREPPLQQRQNYRNYSAPGNPKVHPKQNRNVDFAQNQNNHNSSYHEQNSSGGSQKATGDFRRFNKPPKDEANVDSVAQNINKMSLNNQFASRTFRMFMNLPAKKMDENGPNSSDGDFKVGDGCLAKYWEDGKFYEAIVTAVTNTTCVVRFKGYDNIEEVLKQDCQPLSKQNFQENSRQHKGLQFYGRSKRI